MPVPLIVRFDTRPETVVPPRFMEVPVDAPMNEPPLMLRVPVLPSLLPMMSWLFAPVALKRRERAAGDVHGAGATRSAADGQSADGWHAVVCGAFGDGVDRRIAGAVVHIQAVGRGDACWRRTGGDVRVKRRLHSSWRARQTSAGRSHPTGRWRRRRRRKTQGLRRGRVNGGTDWIWISWILCFKVSTVERNAHSVGFTD